MCMQKGNAKSKQTCKQQCNSCRVQQLLTVISSDAREYAKSRHPFGVDKNDLPFQKAAIILNNQLLVFHDEKSHHLRSR